MDSSSDKAGQLNCLEGNNGSDVNVKKVSDSTGQIPQRHNGGEKKEQEQQQDEEKKREQDREQEVSNLSSKIATTSLSEVKSKPEEKARPSPPRPTLKGNFEEPPESTGSRHGHVRDSFVYAGQMRLKIRSGSKSQRTCRKILVCGVPRERQKKMWGGGEAEIERGSRGRKDTIVVKDVVKIDPTVPVNDISIRFSQNKMIGFKREHPKGDFIHFMEEYFPNDIVVDSEGQRQPSGRMTEIFSLWQVVRAEDKLYQLGVPPTVDCLSHPVPELSVMEEIAKRHAEQGAVPRNVHCCYLSSMEALEKTLFGKIVPELRKEGLIYLHTQAHYIYDLPLVKVLLAAIDE
eukprot:jgi/Bigna1/69658/fgenesh1_pg.9_\